MDMKENEDYISDMAVDDQQKFLLATRYIYTWIDRHSRCNWEVHLLILIEVNSGFCNFNKGCDYTVNWMLNQKSMTVFYGGNQIQISMVAYTKINTACGKGVNC